MESWTCEGSLKGDEVLDLGRAGQLRAEREAHNLNSERIWTGKDAAYSRTRTRTRLVFIFLLASADSKGSIPPLEYTHRLERVKMKVGFTWRSVDDTHEKNTKCAPSDQIEQNPFSLHRASKYISSNLGFTMQAMLFSLRSQTPEMHHEFGLNFSSSPS